MDTPARSHDLTDLINAAATPPAAAACAALHSHLRKLHPDETRSFFSIAFPQFLLKIFGFNAPASASGWIDDAAADPALAAELLDLLSPSGALFAAIAAADRRSAVRFLFPPERLPEWMRVLLLQNTKGGEGLEDLCVLLKGRVRDGSIIGVNTLHLSAFEYFMFWFAYYPVYKTNSEVVNAAASRKRRTFRLQNWTSSLPKLAQSPQRNSGEKQDCDVYMRLLDAYLCKFVLNRGLSGSLPIYKSSMLMSGVGHGDENWRREEFFVNTLVQFWLVDNDFLPVPASLCRSLRVSIRLGEGFTRTPSAGLGEVIRSLVVHLNTGESLNVNGNSVDLVEYGGSSRQIGPWHVVLQRPLYRFILRTFLFCPVGASMKNVADVFSLWMDYIEPWKCILELEELHDQSSGKPKQIDARPQARSAAVSRDMSLKNVYSPLWQGYVLSNYLFYSSLVVHFLRFCHKFITLHPDTIVEMVKKLLCVLTSSNGLMELLKKFDTVYHSQPAGAGAVAFPQLIDYVSKFVPSVRNQLQDWEEGLCKSEVDGSFLHEHSNDDLKLFSINKDGGLEILRLLILRAEVERKAISNVNATVFQNDMATVKEHKLKLFGNMNPEESPSIQRNAMLDQYRQEMEFRNKSPGFSKRTGAGVKYKGDWMRRPITEGEIAWLAWLLIYISCWLNRILGLDQKRGEPDLADRENAVVEVPKDEMLHVNGLWQATRMLVSYIISCIVVSLQFILRYARQWGYRLNLRPFASKKVVTSLFFLILFRGLVKKVLGMP